jgi:hypothetical protein
MTFDGVSHTGTVPQKVDLIYKGTVCGPNVKGDANQPVASLDLPFYGRFRRNPLRRPVCATILL